MKNEPTNRELINYLIKGSKDLIPKGKNNIYRYGEINLYNSLTMLVKESNKKGNDL